MAYRSIFNPARLKVDAMQSEMPKKYWKILREAPLIADLISNSHKRVKTMLETRAEERVSRILAEDERGIPIRAPASTFRRPNNISAGLWVFGKKPPLPRWSGC